MLTCHVYIFFGEVSVKVSGPFLIQVVCFLLSFRSSLYILCSSPLSHVSFTNDFSHSVT